MDSASPPDIRFDLLMDVLTGYGVYMLDAEGRVATWNRGAELMKGYAAAEVVGQPFANFFTPEDQAAGLPESLLAGAREQGRVDSEGWRVRKDGGRFWAVATLQSLRDEAGEVTGYAKVTRDMTEQREAQQALLESERRFRYLVEGVVDYAIYMLDVNGIVTNWNTGAEAIKGYTADEIVGQHVSRFYTAKDRAAGLPQRGLHEAATKGRFEAEGLRVRKDGAEFWASVVIDAIHDETGELIGFAKITRDITERRNAQIELQRAHEQMAKAQKMEALGQLTGGVAHDFNNLLMVVSGQAQMLRKKVGDDPRALRALDAIELSARRGEDLTRHLLTFARRQRLQTTVAPFSERLSGVRELMATTLPPSIQLITNVPDDLWAVEVDQGELDLALLNLSVNARDAMPDGGVLSIAAENVTLDGRETPRGLKGEAVKVTVTDTGSGIPPDILERIFEPFFTTKEVNKGTGLGLSQVYGFAQQAGGDVTVSSTLGEGTRFSLYLPRSLADATGPAADRDATPEARPDRQGVVLVVEDNPEVADVAVGMLEEMGHRVRLAGSAAQALRALQEQDLPDLVFSDIVMAGEIDGLGLARRLRAEHPGLPILLATGYSQASEPGGAEFPVLSKPYKAQDLKAAVSALLGGASAVEASNLIPLERARRLRGRRDAG